MAALSGLARETRHEPATRPPRPGRGAMDWGDVRVFLAVAREGSMRAAGRALGLSQPTIARRLAAFEASFGGQTLFDRLPEGLRLNAAGEQLVAAALRCSPSDRKSTRLNSSHTVISYAVFCLQKKKDKDEAPGC